MCSLLSEPESSESLTESRCYDAFVNGLMRRCRRRAPLPYKSLRSASDDMSPMHVATDAQSSGSQPLYRSEEGATRGPLTGEHPSSFWPYCSSTHSSLYSLPAMTANRRAPPPGWPPGRRGCPFDAQ